MTIPTAMLQADLDTIIADLSTSLVWSGQTITCTVSERNTADDVEDDGTYANVDFECVASIDNFTGGTLPANNATITIGGVIYYIANQMLSQDGLAVTFSLKRI